MMHVHSMGTYQGQGSANAVRLLRIDRSLAHQYIMNMRRVRHDATTGAARGEARIGSTSAL